MNGILRRLIMVIFGLLMLIGAVGLYALVYGGCVIRNVTGIACPTCGMTRAVFAVVTLRFSDALHSHPLVFLLIPLAAVVGGAYVFYDIKPTAKRYVPVYIGTLIIFIIVWIVRLLFFSIP